MTALFFVSDKVFSTIATYYIYRLSASDNCTAAGAAPTPIAVFLFANWLGTICSFALFLIIFSGCTVQHTALRICVITHYFWTTSSQGGGLPHVACP